MYQVGLNAGVVANSKFDAVLHVFEAIVSGELKFEVEEGNEIHEVAMNQMISSDSKKYKALVKFKESGSQYESVVLAISNQDDFRLSFEGSVNSALDLKSEEAKFIYIPDSFALLLQHSLTVIEV